MRRSLVAGNWKMHGNQAEAAALAAGVGAGVGAGIAAEVLVCPPFLHIPLVGSKLAGSAVRLGAQNLCVQPSGAYTGEISGPMLKDAGCTHVIVGHSERRAIYGESDELVAQKFSAAQESGLIPILCVGELLAEREAGQTEAVVGRQLDAVVALAGIASLRQAVIAYEPVWAIGTGKTATPQQAQEVHRFVRERLARHDRGVAEAVRILYGGSVKGSNAAELFSQADIDGGLIGGASLKADEFLMICRAA